MRKRPSRKLYDALSPQELFRLVLSAAARGDERERQEVLARVPEVLVRDLHPEYRLLLECTTAMLFAAAQNLGRFIGWLQALEATAPWIDRAVDVLIGRTEPRDPDEPGFPAFEIARQVALSRLAGTLCALKEVSAAHGLDSGELLRAFTPDLAGELTRWEEAIEAADHDPEATASFREILAESWPPSTT